MTIFAKSANEVVAEITMSRQNWTGSFFIVEGPSDSKFWRSRKAAECQIVIANGKTSTVGAIETSDKCDIQGIIATVDDDHDHILGVQISRDNLIYTDFSDLEMCLFCTRAFDKILCEYGDESSVENFVRGINMDLRTFFCKQLAKLGRLRLLNRFYNCGVDLKDMVVRRFIDHKSLDIDESSVHKYAVAKGLARNESFLADMLRKLPDFAPENICRGHDLIDLLVIGFEGALGSSRPGRERLAVALRSGVDNAEVLAWPMTSRIQRWERLSGMKVLP